jgi:hypothetical protein
MLKAVVQMIEGAHGRMLCACLQRRRPQNFAYRHGMDCSQVQAAEVSRWRPNS